MKKYLYIMKTQVISNLQYVFNVVFNFLLYFVMLFILFSLWRYLYSDPNELINGYSMSQMTWYVIITELLYMTLEGRKLCRSISNDVKSGNIAYNINKPYNCIGYYLYSHLGNETIKAIVYTILSMVTGLLFIGDFPDLNILKILVVLVSMILANIINILFIISIGLISFYIEDSGPLYWIYSKLNLILGTLFPIEYFPKGLQKVLVLSPIYVTCYGPAKLFVDFTWNQAGIVLLAQIIYIFIAYMICYLIYRRGVRKINVNGG